MKSFHLMEESFYKQIHLTGYIVSLWSFQKEKEPELWLLKMNIAHFRLDRCA